MKNRVLLVIIGLAFFIIGYFCSANSIEYLISEEQFEQCERIAHDVDAQLKSGNVILEVPEGFKVFTSTTAITVQPSSPLGRGKVVAKYQNGKLNAERVYEEVDAKINNSVIGIIFALVYGLTIYFSILKPKK